MSEENPYPKNSATYEKFEHRFERLKLPNGELHPWHCWCGLCDVIKTHVHSEFVIATVDEPSDVTNLYPQGATIVLDEDAVEALKR